MDRNLKEKELKNKKKHTKLKIFAGISSVLIIAVFILLRNTMFLEFPELKGTPKVGKWYRILPEGAVDADGSKWHGMIRLGNENKVIVYFYGGGVAVDDYTAQRPLSQKDGFYSDDSGFDSLARSGISSRNKNNPFRDWTVLVIPYSTGDFHAGTGEYEYTDLDGDKQVLHHNGFVNYTKFMEEAMTYIEEPDALLITGFSAGGFGASLLAENIITNYFSNVANVTVNIDSSLLLTDRWNDIAENMWVTPKEISDRLTTDNIVLDSLTALSEKYPDVKILFDCSVRDGELANYQAYFDKGARSKTEKDGDVFQDNLKNMVNGLRGNIKNGGIYIWDGLPYNPFDRSLNLTQHTIISGGSFYSKQFDNDKSIAEWIMDAVNGNVESYGLDLVGLE